MKRIFVTGALLAIVLLGPAKAFCQMGDGDSNDSNAGQSDGNSLNSFGSPPIPSNDAAPPDFSNARGGHGGNGGGGGGGGGCQDSPENSTLILALLAGGTFGLFEVSRHLKSRKRLRNLMQQSRI